MSTVKLAACNALTVQFSKAELYHFGECHCANCHYVEYNCAVCHYVECYYHDCHYAERHGALPGALVGDPGVVESVVQHLSSRIVQNAFLAQNAHIDLSRIVVVVSIQGGYSKNL